MSNISSIALIIDATPSFDMKLDGGISPAVAAGIIVATHRAMHLRGIWYYSWIIKDVQGNRVNPDKLLQQGAKVNMKNIMTKSCGTIGYSVWIKTGAVTELGAQQYVFETEELTTEFLRGIISAAKYCDISINEVLIGKVIRLRILDGKYIASYFDIENLQLSAYNFTKDQLTAQCNFGKTAKSMKQRLDNIQAYLAVKYTAVDADSAKLLIEALLTDAATIFRYTEEANDTTTMDTYMGAGKTGLEAVNRFLKTFELQ